VSSAVKADTSGFSGLSRRCFVVLLRVGNPNTEHLIETLRLRLRQEAPLPHLLSLASGYSTFAPLVRTPFSNIGHKKAQKAQKVQRQLATKKYRYLAFCGLRRASLNVIEVHRTPS
jgi:hypothetical protein